MTVKKVYCIFNPATRVVVCCEYSRNNYTARNYLGTVTRDYFGRFYRSDILTFETRERAAEMLERYALDGFSVFALDPCVYRIIPSGTGGGKE